MQKIIDDTKYKNFNFFENQMSKQWTSKTGNIMVCISLPAYVKKNLNIPVDTRAYFNVARYRVFKSRFHENMCYTRITLDREMNVYVSHKDANGNYSNTVHPITGQQLYDAMKNYATKEKLDTTQTYQEAQTVQLNEPVVENTPQDIAYQEQTPQNVQEQQEPINFDEPLSGLAEQVEKDALNIELDDIQF